jgi:predicted MFS family arabinose efflux permease
MLAQATKTVTLQNRLNAFLGIGLQILGTIFLARLTIDSGIRIVYPFIPQISEGLGLTVVGFSWLIFIRGMAGLMGPVFGILADRYGRRNIMAIGLLFQTVGTAGVAISRQWWAVGPMLLFGLSIAAFWPAGQAYVSDQVAYKKRGRALATIEFSWAISGIVVLPILGWIIDTFGWRSPFLLLSLLSLSCAVMIWFRLPAIEHKSQATLTRTNIWAVCLKSNVLASMGVATSLFVAVSCLITIWGIWLSAEFGLNAVALGLVATSIGVAELSGAGISSLFIDRIGKRRGSQLGLLITIVLLLLLPLSQATLFIATLMLILLGACMEFTIVSLIPLYSEQVPEARATVFSLVGLGASIGGAIASPIAATLWEYTGLWAVCIVAAGASAA